MNPTRALPLVLLFGSMAFSQNLGTQQFSSDGFRANCPVELKASLQAAGKIVPIVPAKTGQNQPDQRRLQITLGNPKSEVASARITVHGYPVGVRVDPAVLYFPDPAEITETIVFNRAVAAGENASLGVAIPGFSTVTSLDLDSVTYSDGSSWRAGNLRNCRAVGLPVDPAANHASR